MKSRNGTASMIGADARGTFHCDTRAVGVYCQDKRFDEELARLHLYKRGACLTRMTPAQGDYNDVFIDGPYKPNHYRY